MSPYNVRKAVPTDIPFIYSSWLKSFRYDSEYRYSTKKSVFFENYKAVVDNILIKAVVYVACSPEDSDVIIGYIVSEPNVVHYAFVKDAFRRLGIAKELFKVSGRGLDAQYTHQTKCIIPIINKYQSLIYNPFLLFKKAEGEENE